jgi:release factor glutamine methyltransferase
MKLETWLNTAVLKLNQAGLSTARLDALVLLEDISGKSRAHLLAHPELELSNTQVSKLDGLVKRRGLHEPLAYLRKRSEFYGRQFYIDHRVLEPRPESEAMIDILKNLQLSAASTIIDIGTGSGMLAITAKLEYPAATVIATDIDQNCVVIARKNAKTHNTTIRFYETDLLKNLSSDIFNHAVILANLPYVPDHFQINPAAMAEPRIAIFGGHDGLDLYRSLFAQAQKLSVKPSYILTEAMPPQHAELSRIATSAGFSLKQVEDFIQLFVYP